MQHKDRFDDALMRAASERDGGLPPGSDSARIRAAGPRKRREELPGSISRECDEIWLSDVTPDIGFEDYSSFEQALRERSEASHTA